MDTRTLLQGARKDYSNAMNVFMLIRMGNVNMTIMELLESFDILLYWINHFQKKKESGENVEGYDSLLGLFNDILANYKEMFFENETMMLVYLKQQKTVGFTEEEKRILNVFADASVEVPDLAVDWKKFAAGV